MVKEAEAHSGEDKKKKELIEARNQADGLVYTTEKSVITSYSIHYTKLYDRRRPTRRCT